MKFDLRFFTPYLKNSFMKKVLQYATFMYFITSFFFFSKIVKTDLGLISLCIIGFILVFLNFKQQRSSKTE
jgi:hypothetical protein